MSRLPASIQAALYLRCPRLIRDTEIRMSNVNIWCVVPAAGIGRRMDTERPKQYLDLCGRMVIEHTLDRLCAHPRIRGVCVALSPEDAFWSRVRLSSPVPPRRCDGGAERHDSVTNALRALRLDGAGPEEWVMVHDAVRPCIRRCDIDRLIRKAGSHPVGGVLGIPVRDTMKRVDRANDIRDTVSRDLLWHAFTPQMFRLGALTSALERATAEGVAVSDEAQAMERVGAHARMVEGHADNIKITTPQDLVFAELCLRAQEEG